jgi:hypothetical protein
MDNYHLHFILRQHTPIIHFQFDQEGATLRPSELKSKLDRFIIGKLEGCYSSDHSIRLKSFSNGKYAGWLKMKDKAQNPALDFQVKVNILEELEGVGTFEEIPGRYPGFFANMGQNNKKFFSFHKFVAVEFFSRQPDLIKKIKDVFPEFLFHTNFGTRQSKGFGSYYLISPPEGFLSNAPRYSFDVNVSRQQDEMEKTKELFRVLDLFYRTLRSGINNSKMDGFYFKSLLWLYLKEKKEMQWDKKTIKQQFYSSNEAAEKLNHQSDRDKNTPLFFEKADNHFLWRDLLGLSSEQSWFAYNKDFLSKTNDNYKRLKSPIFFKPLRTGENDFRVFFDVPLPLRQAFLKEREDVGDAQILGGRFIIKSDNRKDSFPLSFPPAFDFDEFFKFAFTVNLDDHVHPSNRGKGHDFRTLTSIFHSLKAQVNHAK